MYLFRISSILLLCCVSAITAQNVDSAENLTVTINSGTVQGKQRRIDGMSRTYSLFQGIPYAVPPVKELRFRDPVPAGNWEGVLPALKDKPKCIQQFVAKGSEDCLYINVFTPDINGPNLPVMVWIYGGAFNAGSSKIKDYSPDYFIEENVIVVTFNYRLGVFGFLSTEDAASPGNYGLKDQILALKWVRDNIKYFGGDPGSITVFGQSAGSASVAYLLQTPLAKGLFHRAIMQSGTSLNLWALTRNPKTTAFAIGRTLGINTKNSSVLMNALRKIETDTLQAIAVSNQLVETIITNPRNGLIFGPSVEPNFPGAVVIKKSYELLNYGEFNTVPCMVGFNSAEGIAASTIIDYVRPYVFMFDLFSSKLIPIDMNIWSNLQKTFAGIAIRRRYFGIVPISLSDDAVAQFVTDDQFVRPIYEYVSLIAKYVPVYFYRFSYEGVTGIDGKNRTSKGVGHSEEISYMWKQVDNIANPPDVDVTIRKRLVKLWTNFAKTSNPTPEKDDLFQNVIWPRSKNNNIAYLDIGQNLNVSTDMSHYNIIFWKNLYQDFGVPPYDTY